MEMYKGLKLKQFHKFETLINKIKNLRSNMKAWNNQSNETIERVGYRLCECIVWKMNMIEKEGNEGKEKSMSYFEIIKNLKVF